MLNLSYEDIVKLKDSGYVPLYVPPVFREGLYGNVAAVRQLAKDYEPLFSYRKLDIVETLLFILLTEVKDLKQEDVFGIVPKCMTVKKSDGMILLTSPQRLNRFHTVFMDGHPLARLLPNTHVYFGLFIPYMSTAHIVDAMRLKETKGEKSHYVTDEIISTGVKSSKRGVISYISMLFELSVRGLSEPRPITMVELAKEWNRIAEKREKFESQKESIFADGTVIKPSIEYLFVEKEIADMEELGSVRCGFEDIFQFVSVHDKSI